MILRRSVPTFLSLLALPVILSLAGCSTLQTLSIQPAAGSVILTAVGQTVQYQAFGSSQVGSATPTTSNLTTGVTWSVSNSSVATINANGLATAVGAGYTQVVAQSNGVVATSDMTVTIPTTGAGSTSAPTITIIPGTQTVAAPGSTAQFIAIGTTSAGVTTNLTNNVTWSSSSTPIATVGPSTGFVTAIGQGSATITALYTTSTGAVVSGTATFTVTGGTAEKYTAVTILPGTQALSASGQNGQFVALGTSGATGLEEDVTNSAQIKWSSSIPTIASVSATGLATGLSTGTTTITAELMNPDGTVVSNSATVVVSQTNAPEPLLSLTIIPDSITVGNLQDTGQFLAIGTFSTAPYVRDLTNSPTLTWTSGSPSIFPIGTNTGGNAGASAGLVTAFGVGTDTVIAEATSSDGTIQTATATFTCPPPGNPVQPGQCYVGSQAYALLATLTIYNEGLNTTNWEVTAPSATGTANVLHCGPGWALNGGTGGSVCTATYPLTAVNGIVVSGPTIILKAQGGSFGGWSYNCTPSDQNGNPLSAAPYWNATGPNYCTVNFSPYTDPVTGDVINNSNVTVGAIFN